MNYLMGLHTSIGGNDGAQIKMCITMRKPYSGELKLKAASMVLDEDQSVPEIRASLAIGPTALRRRVEQLRKEHAGSTLAGTKAITPGQKRSKN